MKVMIIMKMFRSKFHNFADKFCSFFFANNGCVISFRFLLTHWQKRKLKDFGNFEKMNFFRAPIRVFERLSESFQSIAEDT